MEESSVRWGELVGGLLVVGCSIALVIRLWSEIVSRPILKFSVFIGVTTALFGLGFYSAHRWKLPTTSRGALIISTLLAPLNFLAIQAFSPETAPPTLAVVGGEVFSLALFFFLVYQGAKVFQPEAPWMTALATMGPSFAMLLARHSSAAGGKSLRVALLGLAPLICYCGASAVVLRDQEGRPKKDENDETRVGQIFTHLGVASFAALPPLCLLFIKPRHTSETLRQFAPLVSVFGIPAIATGAALLRWPAESQSGRTLTAATSASLIGSLIALSALIFAWPYAVAVVITALINCAISLAIALASSRRALRYDLRLANIGAIAHLSLAFIILANLFSGKVLWWVEDGPRLAAGLVSMTSAYTLVLLFALFAVASEWSLKKDRTVESRIYGISAVSAGVFSLLLVTAGGFGRGGDPDHAAPAYAFYAIAAFVVAWRREKVIAGWIGSVLSALAILQSLAFEFGYALEEYHPVRLSFLVFANAATVVAVAATVKSERARKLFAGPISSSAWIASVAVAPTLILDGWMTTAQIAARMLWLAVIWLVIAWLKRSPVLFAAFQLSLATSVVFKIAELFGHPYAHSFVGEMRTIQAQAVALAMLSMIWISARLALRRFGVVSGKDEGEEPAGFFDRATAAKLLYPGWPGVDRVITLLLLALLVGLSSYGAYVEMVERLRPGKALSTESLNFAATALGAGSWTLLAALSMVFIAGLWERFEKRAAVAMLILLALVCLLIAGRWSDVRLTLTVWRWSSAVAFAAVSFLIVARNRLTPWVKRLGWPEMEERSNGLSGMLRMLSLALFVTPVLILSSLSFFNRIGANSAEAFPLALSGLIAGLAAPLLIVGVSFATHSVRERSAPYGCAAGLMVNLSVTVGYLLLAAAHSPGIGLADVYTVAQLNIIATSICSLVWIGFHRRQTATDTAWPRSNEFLNAQTGLALFLSLSGLTVADARLFIDPWINSALAYSFGGFTGILAVAAPMLAYAWLNEIKPSRLRAEQLVAGLVAVGSLLSCMMSKFVADGWVAYHALGLAFNAAALLTLAFRRRAGLSVKFAQVADQRAQEIWIATLAWAIVAMTLRGVSSPGEPWWTVGFSISICLIFAGLSLASSRLGYIYFAALALNYAASRVYLHPDFRLPRFFNSHYIDLAGLASLNAVVLALPAIIWLAIDLKLLRQDIIQRVTPFHRVAARTSLGLLIFTLLYQWLSRANGYSPLAGGQLLNWSALASVVALFAACLWDERSVYAMSGLYFSGLIAAGMALLSLDTDSDVLLLSLVVTLSLYALATSALLRGRISMARLATRLKMPLSDNDLAIFSSWLNATNRRLCLTAYTIAFVIVVSFESLLQRLIASTASIAIPISMALQVGIPRNQRPIMGRVGQHVEPASDNAIALNASIKTINLIGLTTWLSLLSFVLCGWAWMSPINGLQAMIRMSVVMLAVGAIHTAYGFIIKRKLDKENKWRRGVRGQLLSIGAVGASSMIAILGVEARNYATFGVAAAHWWVVIAVFATLVSLFCACIAFALSPGRDPFNLSERGRMNYVYAAEVLTLMTMAHARLTLPWFFGGFFLTLWPLIVMLTAFTGVGLGELFRGRGTLVLAEPFERTGILLPILPVLGSWLADSHVSYSGLLFLVGLFYGVLSVMRRSFLFGILAVIAGNGGLWNLLDGLGGYGFYEHPQLWLIPVSISVLVAGHVNRDRLTKDQMTMIRYTTLMMIYVSSTSDIFINGVRESLWLTIVLILLSVTGALTGLMLRIRAFLFLGTVFLLLSLLTMVWTASVNLNWGWLWYVTGIALGAMIIVTFALFEKKRREMLEMVGRLKQWQA
ncbi:MAG: hypothetical protein J2P21_21655 [Chloracidobacterium sp.]|nr:hypothetical protein [Chloracidobacterium sp.]